jgi:predicted O-methyltransferase YrrM
MLPSIAKETLGVRPIDWNGLPHRFMNPGELETLAALFRSVQPRVVIEFGCNEGRTAKALLREVQSIEAYIGIDVERGYVPEKRVQRDEVPDRPGYLVADDPLFRLIIKPRGSFDLTANDLPDCNAVFIDGDHSRRGVAHDTALARELVLPGGLIVWHDYHSLKGSDGKPTVDVPAVLDEMAAHGAKIQHVEGTWLAFERT